VNGPSFGGLGFLTSLRLCGNELRGPLPASLAALAALNTLALSRNRLCG
jgi:Leucine-rich repeat (LRR) protein